MKTVKRILLGLTLGLLLVSCSTDPITEDQPLQVQPQQEEPQYILKHCTFTEQLPYVITQQSEVNWQSDFRKYRRTYKTYNLSIGGATITKIETFVVSYQIPQDELYVWICD